MPGTFQTHDIQELDWIIAIGIGVRVILLRCCGGIDCVYNLLIDIVQHDLPLRQSQQRRGMENDETTAPTETPMAKTYQAFLDSMVSEQLNVFDRMGRDKWNELIRVESSVLPPGSDSPWQSSTKRWEETDWLRSTFNNNRAQ